MRVAVFGASGKVGQLVVRLLLERGYEVTAHTHHSNPFEANAALQIVHGDITDTASVAKAMHGADAIMCTLGSWHTKTKDIVSSGMRTIIPAMEEQGIKRIITLTGSGAQWSEDQMGGLDVINHKIIGFTAPKILRDSEEHLRLLEKSSLDWTCIRSPIMTKSSKSAYKLSLAIPKPWATIPRQAVAQSLVNQIDDFTFVRKAPCIFKP